MDKIFEIGLEVILTAFVSSLFVGAYVQIYVLKHTTKNEWKKDALSKLLGTLLMELGRNKDTFKRYLAIKHQDTYGMEYLEGVFKNSAEKIINMLITHASLMPLDLTKDALKIIEHYDVWLEQYKRHRTDKNSTEKFIFAGTIGYGFPEESEQRIIEYYKTLWKDLYGTMDVPEVLKNADNEEKQTP